MIATLAGHVALIERHGPNHYGYECVCGHTDHGFNSTTSAARAAEQHGKDAR